MPVDRVYIAASLQKEQMIPLENTEFHHLVNVLRFKENDKVEVIDGQGTLAQAAINHIEKKRAWLSIESIRFEKKPLREVILAQALPRINRLDFIIEKGTELGATQFWLFPGNYSERKNLTEHQLERLENLTVAAIKQCGRLYLPKIAMKPSLDEWKEIEMTAYFGDLSPSAEPLSKICKNSESSLFFVGPEAGFSDEEVRILQALGAKGTKLHQNILRTDTAGIVALVMMNI